MCLQCKKPGSENNFSFVSSLLFELSGNTKRFHLLCQVPSVSMSIYWEQGLLCQFEKLNICVLSLFFFFFNLIQFYKKSIDFFVVYLYVSLSYFGLVSFESSQRPERPHQSLFNISDRFCFTAIPPSCIFQKWPKFYSKYDDDAEKQSRKQIECDP